MIARCAYFAGKALASVRESPWVSVLASATIAASLSVLGAYVMGVTNLEGLALVWGRTATLTAYLADDLGPADWQRLAAEVAKRPAVERAEVLTPEQALARFRARGPEAQALVADVDPKVLPASIEMQLQAGFTDLAAIEILAKDLGGVPGIAGVDYGREEFDRLQALLAVLRWGGLVGALLTALATAFIVSNTIRLAVYARRDEIEIQSLVGATAWFIRVPFIVEGALWGLAGGALAAGALFAADRWLAPQLSLAVADVLGGLDVRLFVPELGAVLLAAGVVLGAAGSGLAVRRFLDVERR